MKDIVKFSSVKKPRGIVKIELFDDIAKKKIQEIRGENFVSQGVLRLLAKYSVVNFFTKDAAVNKSIEWYFPSMFRRIRITDATHPEDPMNEWFIRGKQIGYADTWQTYSGTDTERGTININESIVMPSRVRLVFDFPTHAANGTFQSIYFTPESGYYLPETYAGAKINTNRNLKDLGDSFISATTSSTMGSSNGTTTFREYDKKTLEVIRSWELTHSSSFRMSGVFAVKDNYIYYAYPDNNLALIIARAPLSDPTNLSTLANLGELYYSNSIGTNGLVYISSRGQWLLCSRMSGESDYTFKLYDENWNELTRMPYIDYHLSYYDNVLFTSKEGCYLEAGVTNFSTLTRYNLGPSTSRSIVMVDDKFIYTHAMDGTSELYIIPRACIGSRCLLDQPVTKTSTNTMKITYDFILEP